MARLVAVSHEDDHKYQSRQLPLHIDGCSTLVIQFADICKGYNLSNGRDDYNRFVQKFKLFNREELTKLLKVSCKEIMAELAQHMPCVGCRRCVEAMFLQLTSNQHKALEPLEFIDNFLTVQLQTMLYSKELFTLFCAQGPYIKLLINSISIGRKNKRCALHCLESHKNKSINLWYEVWCLMDQSCQEEVTVLDFSGLSTTLDEHLRKHRFCPDCKNKVQRALKLLIKHDSHDAENLNGFNPALYEGLTSCPEEHVHIDCKVDFVQSLIQRGEADFIPGSRERHAKTWDIAQEEVLNGLGVHLLDRMFKVWQGLKIEEQTWHLLFFSGVEALKKKFEVACLIG
ncbi:hypothetical protein HELRODRAFT_71366 [Helobdella robusta]|uniref:Gametogenetin-binding protein 2 n=1 Tax=Helobdella robusta TaxID=6412 RepID=T1G0K5_HELRO|nr:hypothetical protein HELRODRAFT_71366 [Helobdella robusta]ESO11604.1 hypothetical protein HELRODRAFT_71366 [Helobdella robusta]